MKVWGFGFRAPGLVVRPLPGPPRMPVRLRLWALGQCCCGVFLEGLGSGYGFKTFLKSLRGDLGYRYPLSEAEIPLTLNPKPRNLQNQRCSGVILRGLVFVTSRQPGNPKSQAP